MPTLVTAALASQIELQAAAYSAELHAFLEGLPARLRGGRLAQLHAECKALLERAPAAAGERWPRVHKALDDLRTALDTGAARAFLLAKYDEAARAYEHWLAARRTATT